MKSNRSKVTLSIELDEKVYGCIQDFLTVHREWDLDTTVNAGMCLFLLQNYRQIKHSDYQVCSQNYLHLICSEEDKSSEN